MYPGVLEEFLPRFFANVARMIEDDSTHMRALFILGSVEEFGWSAEKHTAHLIKLKVIKPSAYGSELQMVKKFIRDLRDSLPQA